MKALSLLFLFLSVSFQVNAQTATFSNLRLELNSPDNNGRQMVKMHYTMNVSGALGHDVCAALCVFLDRNGTKHYFPNGTQMKSDGSKLVCSWQDTKTTGDWWVGIYNDQLNPLPGRHTYYCQLWAWDFTAQRWIGKSDFLTYDMTGAAPAPSPYGGGFINSPGYTVIGGGGGGNYQYDSGNNSYQNNNNNNRSSHEKMCSKCAGSGKCNTCHGRGTYMPRIGDPYKTCVACGGSGRCTLCNGSGKYGHSY